MSRDELEPVECPVAPASPGIAVRAFAGLMLIGAVLGASVGLAVLQVWWSR